MRLIFGISLYTNAKYVVNVDYLNYRLMNQTKSVTLTDEQVRYVDESCLNLSKLVRTQIDRIVASEDNTLVYMLCGMVDGLGEIDDKKSAWISNVMSTRYITPARMDAALHKFVDDTHGMREREVEIIRKIYRDNYGGK